MKNPLVWVVAGTVVLIAFTSAGILGQLVMVGLAILVVGGWYAARGGKVGLLPHILVRAAVFVWSSCLYFGALVARTRAGRVGAFVVALLAVADLAWGQDAVGFPVVGWTGFFVGAVAVGGWQRRRRVRWEEAVREAVRAAVPGHPVSREEIVRFGSGTGLAARLGRWSGEGDFGFAVPRKMRASDVSKVEEHLREVLPVEGGGSYGFDWDLAGAWCTAALIRDLPTSVSIADLDALRASAAGYAPGDTRNGFSHATRIPIGVSRDELIEWDCSNLYGSALFCGAPGGGKSSAIRTVLAHLLRFEKAWECYLIDPKRVEFGPLRKYPVVREVATDLPAAEGVLAKARAEMERRYRALEKVGVQNIHELNEMLEANGRGQLKHVMVVVDEVAELVEATGGRDAASKEEAAAKTRCSKDIDSISRLGRAAGVHLLLATQRPDAKFISGATKSNIQARLAMGGLSRTGSDMVLESPLASNLPGISGRGIWYRNGKLAEVQTFYTSMKDLDGISGTAA